MWEIFYNFRVADAIDILIVAFVLYRVFLLIRGTLAVQMLFGLAFLMTVSFLSRKAQLNSVSWILENFWGFWVLAMIILFQPELRRALAHVGHGRYLRFLSPTTNEDIRKVIDEVVKGVMSLSSKRIGALIVMERETGLRNYAELGIPVDAAVSAELLGSIFLSTSPLHDGAIFIQDGRISSASCFLPLSRNLNLGRSLGTRHRAALGIAEETDAFVVVVSEETGRISIALEGNIYTDFNEEGLRTKINDAFETKRQK